MATEGKGIVLPPGEGETVSLPGNEISFIHRNPDGAYSLVEWVAAPGAPGTPLHTHEVTDEGFYVLEGAMRGLCGDQTWHAESGSFVWLPRGIPHSYAVDGEETLRSLAITLPAGFERFVAEAGEPARERTLPPPGEPDIEKLNAAAAKVGIEHLGPPEQ